MYVYMPVCRCVSVFEDINIYDHHLLDASGHQELDILIESSLQPSEENVPMESD